MVEECIQCGAETMVGVTVCNHCVAKLANALVGNIIQIANQGMKMEATKREPCDFDITYNNETWHITGCWLSSNGKICWYEGEIKRHGITFKLTFLPHEINVPSVTQG